MNSAEASPLTPAASQRTRTVLVTFLGAVVRRMDNWMPIAGTVELMAQYGLDAPGVRTAVFRLKKRGWLVAESRDGRRGYVLSPQALATFAAGDDVVWHARLPADLAQGWCVINFSVPETARSQRHRLRSHLSSLGFGHAGSALWLAPARMRAAAERAIAELGLTSHCAIFVGEYVGGQDLITLLHASWDFETMNTGYRDFITRFEPIDRQLDDAAGVDLERAFVTYLGVIDQWRKLAYRDPGLPPQVLDETWNAPHAGQLFDRLIMRLEGRALAHAATYW